MPYCKLKPADRMDFIESRARVIALIEDLRNFAPAAFDSRSYTPIKGATVLIEGEPGPPVSPAEER
jgi:hypothetical protein